MPEGSDNAVLTSEEVLCCFLDLFCPLNRPLRTSQHILRAYHACYSARGVVNSARTYRSVTCSPDDTKPKTVGRTESLPCQNSEDIHQQSVSNLD